MRETRCMSLLPRTTLHSDSEQKVLKSMNDDEQQYWEKKNEHTIEF
jgi:hypothetical protein